MAKMPREPEAFSEQVARIIQRFDPESEIELVGMLDLTINGRRLDLQSLYRMVRYDADRGVEIVEHFLDHFMEGEAASSLPLPFDLAKQRLMPRIQPASIFEHLDRELVVHQPFVNDTVLLYVIDMPYVTVSITVEQMIKWGMDADGIDQLARENLKTFSPQLAVRFIEPKDGGRAAIFLEHDGYDASRLLLENLHRLMAPEMGGDFYVATPARDTFVAVTPDAEHLVEEIHQRVEKDFKRLPYPITDKYFLVTQDGIAGTSAA